MACFVVVLFSYIWQAAPQFFNAHLTRRYSVQCIPLLYFAIIYFYRDLLSVASKLHMIYVQT